MAKDGTMRGGNRPGAGRKPKPLADKIRDGNADGAPVLEFPEIEDIEGEEMPKVKDWLNDKQRDGNEWSAKSLYEETWQWLKERGCLKAINPQLIEEYAVSMARWIQCERAVSQYGFIGKHPTTDAAIISPFVAISEKYAKMANSAWFQIYAVVKENCTGSYDSTPYEDTLEVMFKAQGM